MKNEMVYENLKKYAAMLSEAGYIELGYIAVKADDGLYITTPDAEFKALAEEQVAFVTDKSVEELEGNFRAAAVLLICALKSKKEDGAAAIVDSKSILAFSSRRATLPPILEDMAQINGVSIRAVKQNTAAEVVNAIAGARNACFLPDAGALVTGRTLAEVYTGTLVLDKACNGFLLAEPKGGVQHLNSFEAWLEHMVYKMKYSKKNQSSQKAAEEGKELDTAEKPSAIVTDELMTVARESRTRASDCSRKTSSRAPGATSPCASTTRRCSQRPPHSTMSCSSPSRWRLWTWRAWSGKAPTSPPARRACTPSF